MVGHSVAEYKFSQKNQVKTLASAVHIKAASSERIEIDPQHLYQRLLVTCINGISLLDLFKYELCSNPLAPVRKSHGLETMPNLYTIS